MDILCAMRPANPLNLLMRVLFLAVVGFVVAMGTASAHEGRHDGRSSSPSYSEPSAHHSHDQRAHDQQAHDQQGATERQASSDEAAKTDDDPSPCPRDQSPDHASNNCCNIACHAALAATPADSIGTLQIHGPRILGLTDLLVGRLSGRTERPPKLG